MAIGLVGKKVGMTRVFGDDGTSYPVTVVHVAPNRITQIKKQEADGYAALQVTIGTRRPQLLNKAEAGHFAKAEVEAGEGLWELRLDADGDYEIGAELTTELFADGQRVDVTGVSKGKGFAGTVKRHNFRMQDATHGNSVSHRAPGSIGQCQTPGRVFKGKKMAGQMGAQRVTSQNLELVKVDVERNLLLIKGNVPGARGGHVVVQSSVKARGATN